MPRIRTLKPESLQHRKVGRLSDRAFRLWVALITQSDDYGRVLIDFDQYRVLVWGYQTNVKAADVSKAFAELTRAGLVRDWMDSAGHLFAYFPSWSDHQRVQHPSPSLIPEPPFFKAAIPNAVRLALAERHGCQPGKTVSVTCHYCDATGLVSWPLTSRGKPGTWVSFQDLEMDHIQPESLGGMATPENIVLACRRCNRTKGASPPDVAGVLPTHVTSVQERSGTFMNVQERYGGIGSEGIGSEGGEGKARLAPEEPAAVVPAAPMLNGFQIPESVARALDRAEAYLGRQRCLRSPAWWRAEIRAHPGLDVAAEVLKAEAWLVSNPAKAARKRDYARFLHNWFGGAT